MKKVLVLLILAASVVGVGLTYWRRDTATTTVFQTVEVQRGDSVVTIRATGTGEPEDVIDVGAQVAGQSLSGRRLPPADQRFDRSAPRVPDALVGWLLSGSVPSPSGVNSMCHCAANESRDLWSPPLGRVAAEAGRQSRGCAPRYPPRRIGPCGARNCHA
jgi:hypothetical protein